MWGTRDSLTRVQALLEEQRELLLSGKLTDLDKTVQSLASLLDKISISESDPKSADLHRAKQSAERNQRLLANAIRAVKDVTARLQRTQTAQGGFASYSSLGTARTVGASHGKLIKKL